MKHCYIIVVYDLRQSRLPKILSALCGQSIVIVNNSPIGSKDLMGVHIFGSKSIFVIENFNVNGIAGGGNAGVNYAKKLGFKYVTFLDDDSVPVVRRNAVNETHFKLLDQKIIIYCSQFLNKKCGLHLINHSGLSISIDNFDLIGKFNEGLFIDLVDYEFGLQAQLKGFEIVTSDKLVLDHRLGQGASLWFPGLTLSVQAPFRHYYQFRNLICMIKCHKGVPKIIYVYLFLKGLLKVLVCLVVANKFLDRIYFSFCGLRDGIVGRSGKTSRK